MGRGLVPPRGQIAKWESDAGGKRDKSSWGLQPGKERIKKASAARLGVHVDVFFLAAWIVVLFFSCLVQVLR